MTLPERIKPKLWTPADLAAYLDCSINWVHRRTGKKATDTIPHIRLSAKMIRFDPESTAFKEWLAAHGVNNMPTK